jgi:hypothetical protein
MTKIMATVAFSGEFGDPGWTNNPENNIRLDVDAAAAELQRAGYEVIRFPDKYAGRLAHPLDDFIAAVIEGSDDPKVENAIHDEVEAIVCKFGGCCYEWGPIEPGHLQFR